MNLKEKLGQVNQQEALSNLLRKIYVDHSAQEIDHVSSQLMQIIYDNSDKSTNKNYKSKQLWDSSSAVLITYPDGVYRKGEPSLKTLSEFMDKKLENISNIVHILPFLKSSSDGGFAVASHEVLEPNFGDWMHLKELSKKHYLMADLVLNHVSSSHPWVQEFIDSSNKSDGYILSPKGVDGWEKVIRPRSSALFIKLSTKKGIKNVWTTFGPDQIDLDWQNPAIFVEFLKLIIRYKNNGITWLRLDAVAFIWKQKDTTCLHMNEVHKIVKTLRFILESILNNPVIITETNVPEKENLSYLRSGNEAHLAYNFPLPPLLLEALISNKADLLNDWLCNWPDLPIQTSFLNFTASHDGIGLRALEGLMDLERFHNLLVNCEKRGGLISHRRMENGEDRPYELNISWWSAMAGGGRNSSHYQIERLLLSQLFILSLQGVPAFYLQAILASENDIRTFGKSGQRRDLNREKFEADALLLKLEDSNSPASRILRILKSAMKIRTGLKSFHPDAPMKCLSKNREDLVIISRGEKEERIIAIHNMTSSKLSFSFSEQLLQKNNFNINNMFDYLNNKPVIENKLELTPYNVAWIKESK